MLGCDYTGSIKGVGPKRAIELIKNHRSLEKIIENIDVKKYSIPEDWNYKQARLLFQEPEVTNADNVQVLFCQNIFILV
jgi:flap endonuclease-1